MAAKPRTARRGCSFARNLFFVTECATGTTVPSLTRPLDDCLEAYRAAWADNRYAVARYGSRRAQHPKGREDQLFSDSP